MAKRKAAVNDIIYELDNDDIEISSDEEVKQPKIHRLDDSDSPICIESESNTQDNTEEVVDIDSSIEIVANIPSPKSVTNGGKTCDELEIVNNNTSAPKSPGSPRTDNAKPVLEPGSKTTIFNEDIIVDSPASNSDLGVVGCENRTPLVTVRFRDSSLAMSYKKQVKEFMIKLIKLHEKESEDLGHETDIELDIWPEDVADDVGETQTTEDSLFFVDTDPCVNFSDDIPRYSQVSLLIFIILTSSTLWFHCKIPNLIG